MITNIYIDKLHYNGTNYLSVSFKYEKKLAGVCKSLRGFWNPENRCWLLTYSKRTFDFLCNSIKNNPNTALKTQVKFAVVTKDKKVVLPEKLAVFNTKLKRHLIGMRYSMRTVNTYCSMVDRFLWHFKERDPREISNDDIFEYFYHGIAKKGYSVSYQRQFISAIKLFYSVWHSRHLHFNLIKGPRKEHTLPKVISQKEIKDLLFAIANLKHRCLVSVLYSCGLRVGELTNLRVENVDFYRGLLHVHQAKGNKDRVLPMQGKMSVLLKNYLLQYQPKGYLFSGQNGGAYSSESVRAIIHRASKKVGIGINVTPHTLRHSYATHLMEAGVNLRYVQSLLGHKSAETTQIYTHVAKENMLKVPSPFENLFDENDVTRDISNMNGLKLNDNSGFLGIIP